MLHHPVSLYKWFENLMWRWQIDDSILSLFHLGIHLLAPYYTRSALPLRTPVGSFPEPKHLSSSSPECPIRANAIGRIIMCGFGCWRWDEDGSDFIAVFTSSAQWRSNWNDSITPIRLDNDLDVSGVLSLPSIFLPLSSCPLPLLSFSLSLSLSLRQPFSTLRHICLDLKFSTSGVVAHGVQPMDAVQQLKSYCARQYYTNSMSLYLNCFHFLQHDACTHPVCVCEAYPSAARGSSGCASVGALLFSGCHVRSGFQESDRPQ